jgi:hypothetical protein
MLYTVLLLLLRTFNEEFPIHDSCGFMILNSLTAKSCYGGEEKIGFAS